MSHGLQADARRIATGKDSYHQIGLVRGQFGNVPMDKWVKFVGDTGFDGWEEAELGTRPRPSATPTPAPKPTPRNASTSPRSTGWKSSPSPRTCKARPSATSRAPRRCNSSAAKRSRRTRPGATRGNKPPRTDPYFVPEDVGKLVHEQAQKALVNCVRLAHYLGKLQDRKVAAAGLRRLAGPLLEPLLPVPAAARSSSAATTIPDVRQVSLELLVERFGPVLDACKKYGVTYDLECHPSERAMGDIESAGDYINVM